MHFYITGDTHRDFDRIEEFCEENGTTVDDVMIILSLIHISEPTRRPILSRMPSSA